jgi:AAA family ATP:ADP antiporter
MEGFKLIFRSKYLGYIAILVLAYGMTLNLVEITWKDQVKSLYPVKKDFQAFMGNFFIFTGLASFAIGFAMKNVVKRFGWLASALITPVIILVTSIMFFGFSLYSDFFLPASLLATSLPLTLAVVIGAMQNIASKSTKYALFDPTTQMTYIPLDDDLRVKGKAAVDVIGGRLGKSLGGHIQSVALILSAGSQLTIAPMLMGIIVMITVLWIYAAKKLSIAYEAKLKEQE